MKSRSLDIGGGGSDFIRLVFFPVLEPCRAEYFVFVNNEDDQSEECLLLRVEYKK